NPSKKCKPAIVLQALVSVNRNAHLKIKSGAWAGGGRRACSSGDSGGVHGGCAFPEQGSDMPPSIPDGWICTDGNMVFHVQTGTALAGGVIAIHY
ncbi:MAG: hypothetical protein WBO06_08010, partial [Gammaproteobacteria bacterium]